MVFKLLKEWSKTGCKAAFISVLESYIADVIRTKNWATITVSNFRGKDP